MGQPSVLVIGAGWEQVPLIRTAKSMGIRVMATAPAADAEGLAHADVTAFIDPLNVGALLKLARDHSVDAVVADQCDYSYFAVALLADALRLPGPGLAAAQRTTNKRLMREAWMAAGVHQPEFRTYRTLADGVARTRELGFPAISKPVDNRGNFGVNRLDDSEELNDSLLEAIAHAHSREAIVERFIDGVMVTADGFAFGDGTHRTLAIATKRMLGGRKRVAMEIRYPAELPEDVVSRIRQLNDRAVAALGICSGMTHAEYLVDSEGEIWPVEMANRGGGVYTSAFIVHAVSGVDVTRLLLQQALGERVAPPESITARSALLRFFALPPGRVLAVDGISDGARHEGVLAMRLMTTVGEIVRPITNDAARHGFVIATGDSLSDADAVADNALRELRVQYEGSGWTDPFFPQ